MPRVRRSVSLSGGSAPPELRNPTHKVWQSATSAESWLERVGLGTAESLRWVSPLNRHSRAARLWAMSAGMVQRVAGIPIPFPDWAAMRAAGIPESSGLRLAEQLALEGVRRVEYA